MPQALWYLEVTPPLAALMNVTLLPTEQGHINPVAFQAPIVACTVLQCQYELIVYHQAGAGLWFDATWYLVHGKHRHKAL
jgi:hypothetical protein